MDKKHTIKDIAKLAGVSKGTVDRVLHKRGKVSPAALEKVNEELENSKGQIANFNKTCVELEKILSSAIQTMRDAESNPSSFNKIDKDHKIKLDEADNDNVESTTEARKNLPHMFNLTSSLIQILLMTLAAGAKYNTELNKLARNRCDEVIGKCQSMATEYAQLISTMNAISKSI